MNATQVLISWTVQMKVMKKGYRSVVLIVKHGFVVSEHSLKSEITKMCQVTTG